MMDIDQETVYGTNEDSHVVMSEKVQSLAGSIYQEFEKMIGKYDEDVVKDLMPLVVNVLECLDLSYTENQEHEVELELLREDNEQLVTQYEREKQLRKNSEQKLLELEDAGEDERKDLSGKIESLESIVRMLELKAKNASDHVARLEEKESEQKREYSKLHERYTELFKTHVDYMERTKLLMGSAERLEGAVRGARPSMSLGPLNRSPMWPELPSGPNSFGFGSLDPGSRSVGSPSEFIPPVSPPDSNHSNTSLRNEMQGTHVEAQEDVRKNKETSEKGQLTDAVTLEHRGTVTRGGWVDGLSPDTKESTPELEDVEEIASTTIVSPIGRSKTKKEQRSGNTLYQELSFQDAEALGEMDEGADITGSWVHPGEYASSVNDNFFGMGKEVENLILENTELLATKNALNIVKDDLIVKVDELTSEQEILREEIKSLHTLKNKLKQRIQDLEEELKKAKEEAEKATKAAKSDDEEDVPMAQRKRFTRVEMARVLMERNQYKEKFMELQEAVRWTEMIRASRNDSTLDKKSKQSIWKFFSNLFSTPERPQRKPLPYVNVRYNAPTHHVAPALESMRKRSLTDRKRGLDYLDGEISSEKLAQRRATERREQYRQVRAHVRKDDGRLQAYGWSLPAKVASNSVSQQSTVARLSSSSHVPVPVPVYCRPLQEKELGMKIWCAAGVNLSGGRTRDGGSIVGASVFYTRPEGEEKGEEEQQEKVLSEVDKLNQELKEGEKLRREGEQLEQQLSSLVWICTSTHAMSKVTVIDANNPADILKSFNVSSSRLLCIASVPGAKESDYISNDEELNNKIVLEQTEQEKDGKIDHVDNQETEDGDVENDVNIGRISFVSCATGSEAPDQLPNSSNKESLLTSESEGESGDTTPVRRLVKEVTGVVKDGVSELPKENEHAFEELEKMSSVLPTMWLGAQNGTIYVHSAVAQWCHCIHSVKMKDSVLSIVHVQGRVLAAIADGTVAVFQRGPDGQWELNSYHLVSLGKPPNSIRTMVAVHGKVWCGYRNRIHVLHPRTLTVEKSFDAHPRKESQVRQMVWLGDGVWVSIRLDSTLRLYHAHTYQHLQDVDIEPYVSKMLGTGKLGFSYVRITALLISSNRLWIGTGNGVIISVPLSEHAGNRTSSNNPMNNPRGPGGVVRVYADNSKVYPGSFVPFCSMAQAQLSFHGHRDSVKFFVAVPGNGGLSNSSSTSKDTPLIENMDSEAYEPKRPASMLVMSGGEGYIDFRIGDGEEEEGMDSSVDPLPVPPEQELESRGERSHLIVWQVTVQD